MTLQDKAKEEDRMNKWNAIEWAKVKPINLPETMPCPVCDGTMKLLIENFEHCTANGIYKGNFYVYRCNKCNERFTTTASDGESIKSLKPVKK